MKGNFGLYVVPSADDAAILKIDYTSGNTWRYVEGKWVAIPHAK